LQGRREGDRAYTIEAVDVVGKSTRVGPVKLTLTAGAEMPESDGNDTLDDAGLLGCGGTLELDGNSATWFSVDARGGTVVDVSVEGADPEKATSVVALNNDELVTSGDNAVQFDVNGGDNLNVAVFPPEAGHPIQVSMACEKKPAPAATCATQAPATPLALLGLLALVRRRRPSRSARVQA
jgi:hypothetical protein